MRKSRPFPLLLAGAVLLVTRVVNGAIDEAPSPVQAEVVRDSVRTIYRGEAVGEAGVVAFRGIPFARPPVAERRWQKPELPVPVAGVVDATRFAPACMQSGSGLAWYHDLMQRIGADPAVFPAPDYSEDCLYLNIWSDLSAGPARPVIVYVHGGSNTGGWSYEPNYRGAKLAERGVVLVSVAYRLGVFGFLTHPDLPDRNVALHDLALALSWVRDHIAAFGGDPERITLMGESAGAANASHLMVSPLSRGMAQRLIHQSGGWQFDGIADLGHAEALGREFETRLVGEGGGVAAMRSASTKEVLARAASVYDDFYFSPVPDPVSLPASLSALAAGGKLPAFDLLLGTNADEALMYLGSEDRTEDWLLTNYGSESGSIAALVRHEASDAARLNLLRTARQFACPSARLASAVAQAGGSSYVYEFRRVREGLEAIGAYHGAELPYVFDTHDTWLPTGRVDRRLTERMVSRWLSFAATGQPADADGVAWPPWQPDSPRILRLDDAITAAEPSFSDLCRAFGS